MSRSKRAFLPVQMICFYLVFTLKFPGMSKETPMPLTYLWECISWLSVFVPLYMGFCFLATVYVRFGSEDTYVLFNVGFQGAWLVSCFISMLTFKVKSKDLGDMINLMEDKFQWRSARGKTYVDVERVYKYAKMVSIIWQLCPTSTVVAVLVRPLLKRPVVLPLDVWYPANMDNPYQFALAYFLQAWSQLIVVCGFAAGSSFFFSFGLLLCGQFNVLRCSLKNLIFTSDVYKRFPETLHINNPSNTPEYLYAKEMKDNLPPIPGHKSDHLVVEDIENIPSVPPKTTKRTHQLDEIPTLRPEEIKSFHAALKACVEHHLILLKLCVMMENFLSFFAFLRVLEMTLHMCLMAFLYEKTSDIVSLLFGVLAGIDLFLLTYPADHIRDQNHLVGPSLVMGPWYLVSKHFRNEFLIIQVYSQRPIIFTAGKIIQLNADRLRQVLTTAFSYYTLLSSLDEG